MFTKFSDWFNNLMEKDAEPYKKVEHSRWAGWFFEPPSKLNITLQLTFLFILVILTLVFFV